MSLWALGVALYEEWAAVAGLFRDGWWMVGGLHAAALAWIPVAVWLGSLDRRPTR